MGVVRCSQIDGKLPNLALMKLAAWHRARGDEVRFYAGADAAERHLDEPAYERVYGSAIFTVSSPLLERFLVQFPEAVIGGTGTGKSTKVEDLVGGEYEHYDYSITRGFKGSIGFTQRGCRLSCKFCVVPAKEGKPRSVNRISDIWRGAGHAKNLHLLDNDFFGQPRDQWEARIDEIRTGGFRVCLNQGINIRMVDKDSATALASIEYRDDAFGAAGSIPPGTISKTRIDLWSASVPFRQLAYRRRI